MNLTSRLKSNLRHCRSAEGVTVGLWFTATALVAALGLESLLQLGFRSTSDTGFLASLSAGLWSTVMVPFYIGAYFSGALNSSRFSRVALFRDALKGSIRITMLATFFGLTVSFAFLLLIRVSEMFRYGQITSLWTVASSMFLFFILVAVFASLWTIPVGCLSGVLLFAVTRSGRASRLAFGGITFVVMAFCLLFGIYSFSRRTLLPADTPRISALRPIGTACGPHDSASIRRAAQHPMGPTGGWSSIVFYDGKRTKDLQESAITFFDQAYTGYVRFKEPGTLKIRAYDDLYGAVYCGWSENSIRVEASERATFFQLGLCAVGDGGVSTVHEICWFPDGQAEGRVLLSSEYSNAVGEKLEPADLFVQHMLDSETFAFHRTGSLRSIALSFAKRGNFAKAQEIVAKGIDRFNAQPPAIEMPTNRRVSPQELHSDDWVQNLSMEIGLDIVLGELEAAPSHFERLEQFVTHPPQYCSKCEYTRTMLPLYRWLLEFERALKTGSAIPDLPRVEPKNVYAHNPQEIVDLLRQAPGFVASQSQRSQYEFWLGIHSLMNGDRKAAAESFRGMLNSDRSSLSPLEAVVAARHAS